MRGKVVFIWTLLYLLVLLLLSISCQAVSASECSDFEAFLAEDSTDSQEYLPWYTCGHFSRDLARNASLHNLSIGSVIMSDHPVFGGRWNSHIMNYIEINGSLWLIEPQTDQICSVEWSNFRYLRFYPDGTQVPSNWGGNLAHDLDLDA